MSSMMRMKRMQCIRIIVSRRSFAVKRRFVTRFCVNRRKRVKRKKRMK
jgi:hypothetical protein